MYSVLIQTQETMKSFEDFRAIFLPVLKKGEMAVCQLMEAGTTVDTTIPGIYDLIDDKEEWKAVVVVLDDEKHRAAFPTRPDNPYDFLENASEKITTKESKIPLIRLTQMLGGVPAPMMRFQPQIVREKEKEDRVIYLPQVDKEEEETYKELRARYEFKGKFPTEIVLVTLRPKKDAQEPNLKQIWAQNIEAESSEFWKRNRYPSICRFTVFEMTQEGTYKKNADLFALWMAVMLMASNEIDPSTLQAYKLHQIFIEFDEQKMRQAMQDTVVRAVSAKKYIHKRIKRELEQKLNEEVVLPDYQVHAPVVLKLPKREKLFVSGKRFGLVAKGQYSDMELWNEMNGNAQKEMDTIGTCTERALDQTAERIRHLCRYKDHEVYALSKYQIEEMNQELEHRYRNILELRKEMPQGGAEDQSQMAQMAKGVKGKLLKRVTSQEAFLILIIAAVLFVISLVPALFLGSAGVTGAVILGMISVAGIGILAAVELGQLTTLRTELQFEISKVNGVVNRSATSAAENSSVFSRYMGEIASNIHGNTFLSVMEKKKNVYTAENYEKENHIAALEKFISNIRTWCTSYHLQVYFDSAELNENLTVDTELPPDMNPLYTFEMDGSYRTAVNNTGDTIEAPFGFIKKLGNVREELYDDAE